MAKTFTAVISQVRDKTPAYVYESVFHGRGETKGPKSAELVMTTHGEYPDADNLLRLLGKRVRIIVEDD